MPFSHWWAMYFQTAWSFDITSCTVPASNYDEWRHCLQLLPEPAYHVTLQTTSLRAKLSKEALGVLLYRQTHTHYKKDMPPTPHVYSPHRVNSVCLLANAITNRRCCEACEQVNILFWLCYLTHQQNSFWTPVVSPGRPDIGLVPLSWKYFILKKSTRYCRDHLYQWK